MVGPRKFGAFGPGTLTGWANEWRRCRGLIGCLLRHARYAGGADEGVRPYTNRRMIRVLRRTLAFELIRTTFELD
jgi:hypothetical protein